MDERTPTRISPHGYPVYEKQWNEEIRNCITKQGLETALITYPEDEIVHHLGGEAYGAKIGPDYVVIVDHFDHSRTWEEVKPLLDLFEGLRYLELLGATLTGRMLSLQLKISRLQLSDVMLKSVTTIGDRRLKGHMIAVQHLPFTEALEMKPQIPTTLELKGWGFTDTEITEREQTLAETGFTAEDLIYDHYKVRLIYRELDRIGVIVRR